MGTVLSLTIRAWTHVLRAAIQMKLPAKVGTREFNHAKQALFTRAFTALLKILGDGSPIYRQKGLACFGPADAWQLAQVVREGVPEKDIDGKPMRPSLEAFELDPLRVVEVEVPSGLALVALEWIAFLWHHPASPYQKNPGFLEEIAQPLVEQLNLGAWLDRQLGIDDEPKVMGGLRGDVNFETDGNPLHQAAAK